MLRSQIGSFAQPCQPEIAKGCEDAWFHQLTKHGFASWLSQLFTTVSLSKLETNCNQGLILDNLSIFSEKQRRFLRSDEWAPNKLREDREDEDAKAEEEDDRKPSPSLKRGREARDKTEKKVDGGKEAKRTNEGRASEGKADVKATDNKTNTNKRNEESKSADAEKDAGGGWTFTIRERPMPDPSTSKKRRKGDEDSQVPTFTRHRSI